MLVAFLFFMNIVVEVAFGRVIDKWSEMFSNNKVADIEDQDPAALVGTFKRYK